MKSRRSALFFGVMIGVLLSLMAFAVTLGGVRIPRTYTVRSVDFHLPSDERDTYSKLIVYRRGDSGNVKEVACHFPPGFQLDEGPEDVWTGIERVRTGSVAETYAGLGESVIALFCRKIE